MASFAVLLLYLTSFLLITNRIVGFGSTYRPIGIGLTTCPSRHANCKSNNVHLLSNVSPRHGYEHYTFFYILLPLISICLFRYAITPTGLGAEISYDFINSVNHKVHQDSKDYDFRPKEDASTYLLRPEGKLS